MSFKLKAGNTLILVSNSRNLMLYFQMAINSFTFGNISTSYRPGVKYNITNSSMISKPTRMFKGTFGREGPGSYNTLNFSSGIRKNSSRRKVSAQECFKMLRDRSDRSLMLLISIGCWLRLFFRYITAYLLERVCPIILNFLLFEEVNSDFLSPLVFAVRSFVDFTQQICGSQPNLSST